MSLVDWSKSGGSQVDVKIAFANGKSIPNKLKQLRSGVHECTFTPTEPGLYLVDVYINNIQLPGKYYSKIIKYDKQLQNVHTSVKLGMIRRLCVFAAMVLMWHKLAEQQTLKL